VTSWVTADGESPRGRRARRASHVRGWVACAGLVVLLSMLSSGCRLLAPSIPNAAGAPNSTAPVAPLSAWELLSFSFDNLGEVEPGLAYRSAKPDAEVLEFLLERARLGEVVSFISNASDSDVARLASGGRFRLTSLPRAVDDPPSPRDVLAVIRATLDARKAGKSVLFHCKAGADRTGGIVAVWRLLFQNAADRDALRSEAFFFGHVDPWNDAVRETIASFRPELYRPFIERPELLDDASAVARLERRYFAGQALASGDTEIVTGPLRVGVGRVDLLQDLELPVQMATYGPSPGEASGVRAKVWARSIVLDNGGKRIGIVALDILIFDLELRDEILSELETRGVELDDILFSATHSHTSIGGYVDHAPSEFYITGTFRRELRTQLARCAAEAIALADADLRPARVGVTRGWALRSGNRRLGELTDPQVGVLSFIDENGLPRAVVVEYAAHPILEPDDGQISGDYPALLCAKLDAEFGFGLFLQGALGDINARAAPDSEAWRTAGLAATLAEDLFEVSRDAIAGLDHESEIALGSMTRSIPLPALNLGFVPDLLFPIDLAIGSLLDWPKRAIVQTVRIGSLAIAGSSSEIGVRISLAIQRQSVAPHVWPLAHVSGYSGYALSQVEYALSKLDATSIPSLNGSTHGRRIVDAATQMLAWQWQDIDPTRSVDPRVSASARAWHEEGRFSNRSLADVERAEAEAIFETIDPTRPQAVRSGVFDDLSTAIVRGTIAGRYESGLRGGAGARGHRREARVTLRGELPAAIRLEARTAWVDSTWHEGPTRRDSEGLGDLEVDALRFFDAWKHVASGNGLRIAPVIGLSIPVGEHDATAPNAFSPSIGLFAPRVGLETSLTWETYRQIGLRCATTWPIGHRDGRRAGGVIECAIGYAERHGAASLALDLVSTLRLEDARRGGETSIDVSETSHGLALRPSFAWQVLDGLDPFVAATLPIARSGASGGIGVEIGLVWSLR
jgi:neutral ceramidase